MNAPRQPFAPGEAGCRCPPAPCLLPPPPTAAAPITAIEASRCGSLALSGDAQGGLKLWSLADGALLAAATAAAPGAPVAAACFLADGAAATLQQHSSVAQIWSTAGSTLKLLGELDAAGGSSGSTRTVTALSASGPLLALGCSDGSTLVWRRSGSEFEQHARIAPPRGSEAPVHCLTISSSSDRAAALLAVAAGPAVAISSLAATGEPLAERTLAAVPAALYWRGAGELHALLPEGCKLQRLGAPQPAAAAAAVPRQAAAGAAAAASPRKKAVRFADSQAGDAAGGGWPQAADAPMPATPSWQPGMPARSAPPPLPTHPLLRTSRDGSAFGPPAVACSSAHTSSYARDSSGSCRSTPAAAATPGRLAPYPVLDLRALQGLCPASATSAAACVAASLGGDWQPQAAVAQRRAPPGRQLPARQCAAAAPAVAPAAGISTTRSQRHAGTCTEPVEPAVGSLEHPAQEGSPSKAAAAAQPASEDADGEAPQPRSLPLPLQRQRSQSPAAANDVPRVSKQRCDACKQLAAAPGEGASAAGSRPGSPAKAALLAQVAELGREAAAAEGRGDASPQCRIPTSPLKLGVVCTRQDQQDGQLLLAEARPCTGGRQAAVGVRLHACWRVWPQAQERIPLFTAACFSTTAPALQWWSTTLRWRTLSSASCDTHASPAAALRATSRRQPRSHLLPRSRCQWQQTQQHRQRQRGRQRRQRRQQRRRQRRLRPVPAGL